MNELARLRGSERYGACDDEGKEPHRAHPPGTSAGRTAGTLHYRDWSFLYNSRSLREGQD